MHVRSSPSNQGKVLPLIHPAIPNERNTVSSQYKSRFIIVNSRRTDMETSPDRSFPIIVGCESCVEAMPLIGGGNANAVSADEHRKMRIATKVRRVEKTEYPPLIPLLARTESLHSRMPWVLRRYCTSDGRLVLREERVRHHEYLRAHRSGGRLTLHLVHLEDNGFDLPIVVDPDDDKNSVWNSYLDSKDDISHEKNRKMMIIRNISSCQRAKQR